MPNVFVHSSPTNVFTSHNRDGLLVSHIYGFEFHEKSFLEASDVLAKDNPSEGNVRTETMLREGERR